MDKVDRKRDRLEIIYDILKIVQDNHNSIKPTPLLRYSNLSSQSFNEYIKDLEQRELILFVKDKKSRKYVTLTTKGFEYLDKYSMIKGFIQEFEL